MCFFVICFKEFFYNSYSITEINNKLSSIGYNRKTINCSETVEDKEAKISIENMPERFSYLGNRAYELENLTNETGCHIVLGKKNAIATQIRYTP